MEKTFSRVSPVSRLNTLVLVFTDYGCRFVRFVSFVVKRCQTKVLRGPQDGILKRCREKAQEAQKKINGWGVHSDSSSVKPAHSGVSFCDFCAYSRRFRQFRKSSMMGTSRYVWRDAKHGARDARAPRDQNRICASAQSSMHRRTRFIASGKGARCRSRLCRGSSPRQNFGSVIQCR